MANDLLSLTQVLGPILDRPSARLWQRCNLLGDGKGESNNHNIVLREKKIKNLKED
jgi:hypothetical protein